METKAMVISAKPEECLNILKLIQSILVRKKFPKDYVGWVYIYCTKGGEQLYSDFTEDGLQFFIDNKAYGINILNGYVVARFWCDKVEEIMQAKLDNGVGYDYIYDTDTLLAQDFVKKCCLNNWDLLNYFGYKHPNGEIVGCAIHITKLEVFEEPKELTEFYYFGHQENLKKKQLAMEPSKNIAENFYRRQMEFFDECWHLKMAPKNWCYIDEEEEKYGI